ncbi:hypothetical protein BGZ73_005214 [Actinomortierella ambigua]|nr:hypothetical protein BGZ73_005214 [Actinomortierella ambigua]
MEVFAKQRIRHSTRQRRTGATPPQANAQGQQHQHQQQQQQVPDQTHRETAQTTTTDTATSDAGGATTTTAGSPTLLETVRMRRDGLWAFEYWVEDAILFMCFPVKLKTIPPRSGPMSSHAHRASQGRLSFYLHDEIEERPSYESISDLPTPAPLTSSSTRPSTEFRAAEATTVPPHTTTSAARSSPNHGRVDAFRGFTSGSSFAVSIAQSNTVENERRRQQQRGGIMNQTFSSALSVRSSFSSSSGITGSGHSNNGRVTIPANANLFALVSASDPQACLWRSTCFGESIERCFQMSTNEDVMMWWRERLDQTFEFGRKIGRRPGEGEEEERRNNHQQSSSDLEAGQQQASGSNTTIMGTAAETATTQAASGRFARLRRLGDRMAAGTRPWMRWHQNRQTANAQNNENDEEADAGMQRRRRKVPKKRPFFDKRDWNQGIWKGVKIMLIKIGVSEIPAPHHETMELSMRVRGLYYCWREITHTHLDSDDEDEDDLRSRENVNDDDVLSSLRLTQLSTNQYNNTNGGRANSETTAREPSLTPRTSSQQPPTSRGEMSLRAAIRSARNERRRRGKGKGRARMFVFDRDDTLVNGKRVHGMIVAEIWIGHDEPTPEEAEEETRLEAHRRRMRRHHQHHSDQWANAITHGSGRHSTGLSSADVESFILTTGPRLPELYEVFDHDSYHPRISRCRVMLYSVVTIAVFAAVFFARLATISDSGK